MVGGSNRFVVTVDGAGHGAIKSLNVPSGRPSTAAAYDPRSSVSQRVQAVTAVPVQPGSWSSFDQSDEDWPGEWCYDWDGDWTDEWHGYWWWTASEQQLIECHDDESSYLVCGIAGSRPKHQSNENVKLMIDSGTQQSLWCAIPEELSMRPAILRESSCGTLRISKWSAWQDICRCAGSRTSQRDTHSCKHQSGRVRC